MTTSFGDAGVGTARDRWRNLDATVRTWWDQDVVTWQQSRDLGVVDAMEMPRPYVAGGADGSPFWYSTMFNWDAYFSNLALLAHGRLDLVRDAIENYLAMIDRLGYMPNGNQLGLSTRSQTPLFPDSIERYLTITDDQDLAARAYPRLVAEYRGYWTADHHSTPTGLATNRDLGDPTLDPRLASEAETGLDWTPLYEGDVRAIAPVITNAALVRYARVLAEIAARLGLDGESEQWHEEARGRAALLQKWCWNETEGFFYDYHHVQERFVTGAGATGLWALWAGAATSEQAARCVEFLPRLLGDHGLATTETSEPSPYPDLLDDQAMQWMYPAGWAPLQMIAVSGLDAYGFSEQASDIAERFVSMVVDQFDVTGRLYEKYNVVDGTIVLPNDRYGTIPLHGWTSAAVVLLGRRLYGEPAEDRGGSSVPVVPSADAHARDLSQCPPPG
ncbi:MAG: trehalase family glycosidase [Nakamurella sp.]